MKKQQDEDPMEKGARDGKAEARPDENREAMAFALNFTLVTFFVSRQRKWQIYNPSKLLKENTTMKSYHLVIIIKLLPIGIKKYFRV